VNAELPGTEAFASAAQHVTEDDIAESTCGPDPERHLDAVRRLEEVGFTHLTLV
jgi:hypothetical protein